MKRTIKGLTAPNRIFGKGESREQNAIIKVYSVQELKNALTKIYSFKGSIGTIQIAGDITISEPIQLKQFIEGEAAPKEIIIQSIAGARILNGNKAAGDWDYDMTGNTEIPVFDVGFGRGIDLFTGAPLESQLIVKYTFLDLVINSDTSRPFGAFIAAKTFSPNVPLNIKTLSLGEIKINNIKLFNVHTLLAGYSTDSSFASIVTAVTPNIDGVSVRNTSSIISEFYFNNAYFGIIYGLVNNVGTWNKDNRADNSNIMNIYTSNLFRYNSFESIGLRTKILEDPNATFFFENGFANTFSGGEIIDFPANDSFAFSNTIFSGQLFSSGNTIIPTRGPSGAFNIVTPTEPITGTINFVVENTFCLYKEIVGSGSLTTGPLPKNSEYEVNWHLTIKRRATDEVNTYHIKTNVRRVTGNLVIVSNNTIAASEEFLGMTGLIPVVGFTALNISPVLGSETLDVSVVVKMTGKMLPQPLISPNI